MAARNLTALADVLHLFGVSRNNAPLFMKYLHSNGYTIVNTKVPTRKHYRKKVYWERKTAGICIMCKLPASDSSVYCEEHREYRRIQSERRNQRLRERDKDDAPITERSIGSAFAESLGWKTG